jgi:hypothetical protein
VRDVVVLVEQMDDGGLDVGDFIGIGFSRHDYLIFEKRQLRAHHLPH